MSAKDKLDATEEDAAKELAVHITRNIIVAGKRVGMAALLRVVDNAGPETILELRKVVLKRYARMVEDKIV